MPGDLQPQVSELQVKASGAVGFQLVPRRNLLDDAATAETFKARGNFFELLDKSLAPKLEIARLVSSVHGQISRVLLTIPAWVFLKGEADQDLIDKYAGAFKAYFALLPKTTRFVVLVHEMAVGALAEWTDAARVTDRTEVVPVRDDMPFTVWAEDAYCVAHDDKDGETFLVEPASFTRANDALIADEVAKKTDLETTLARLYFQGGNVLIGDDFWFIGADYPANSVRLGFIEPKPGEPQAEAVRRAYSGALDHGRTFHPIGSRVPVPAQESRSVIIEGQIWTELLFYGNHKGTVQPLFHIDMFITLAGRAADGRPRVLVGDPKLAAQVLSQPVNGNSMPEVFDDIAKQLEMLGFTVVRNPLPLVYDDDRASKTRAWYFATSNNCLVQDGPDKCVWLPTYGHEPWPELAATDQANRAIWEGLGFEVRQLPDFHPFAAKLGAAHCIKKYLKRG